MVINVSLCFFVFCLVDNHLIRRSVHSSRSEPLQVLILGHKLTVQRWCSLGSGSSGCHRDTWVSGWLHPKMIIMVMIMVVMMMLTTWWYSRVVYSQVFLIFAWLVFLASAIARIHSTRLWSDIGCLMPSLPAHRSRISSTIPGPKGAFYPGGGL